MIRDLLGLLFPARTATLNRHEAAEHELARTEERLQLAKSIGHIGTWAIDDLSTGQATMANGLRKLYGLPPDAPTGYEDFLALVYPEDRGRLETAVARAIETGGSFEVEYRLRRPDGETLWLLGCGDVVKDDQGKPVRVLGVAMDVSERKAADRQRVELGRQLRQAHKLEAVGRLAGGVAHDFNNLLLGIRGYTELAARAFERKTDPGDYLEQISAAVDRATALTRQLLVFSRKQVLLPERIDLNHVVRQMESLLRQVAGEGIELEAISSSEDAFIEADRGQLEQVIINLAVNARDSMPTGGRLTFEVGKVEAEPADSAGLLPGPCVLLSVADTGCGMDADTVERVFEPFFTTKSEGTGLGLAMAHGIVTQSGGTISARSELGEGTTFRICLPLAELPHPSPERRPPKLVVA
jgi:two-component system, cell cycle sensor histidine kinase and response regulator CckA